MDLGLHTIACPNCGTSYQLPAGAIGPKGRRLVCSVCQTDWRAMPDAVPVMVPHTPDAAPIAPTPGPAMPAAPPVSAAPGRLEGEAPTDPAPMPPMRTARAAPASPPATVVPPPPSPERLAQMAEIRQMLAELKHPQTAGPDDGPPPMRPQRARGPDPRADAAPAPQTMTAQPGVTGAADPVESDPDYDDDVDPLRARLAQHNANTKAYRADPVKNPYDRAKLMRKHDRKIRRRRLQESRGSGAFVTGFLLMIMVAAGMTAIYILHPQIIARFPGAEKPLLDYVATIDGVRVSLAQTSADALGWIRARLFRE